MKTYFDSLHKRSLDAYKIAVKARAKRLDPFPEVEISITKDLTGRVEGLLSTMIPELKNSGLRERLLEMETKYGKGDERIGFLIANETADGKFVKWDSVERAIEVGLRVGTAYWTLGVVTAPLEGVTHIEIKKRADGKSYLAVYFAGPIRSAGGTTNAMIMILADYLRKKFELDEYDATDEEIERYVLELEDYHKRVTRLQYWPDPDETRLIAKNLPVEVAGEPTEKFEVLAYKDLPRIETNRIRGGMALTMSMIALKSAKLIKRIKKFGPNFNLSNWAWLEKLEDMKHSSSKAKDEGPTYLNEIPGGRPVFSFPNEIGGFRLRYGRARNTGFASVGVHPATMAIVDDFLAIGTQIKTELPGKAAAVAPVDSIDGPIVRLNDGSIIKISSSDQAIELRPHIEKILFVGDILISYGEFLTNGHQLEVPGWCEEWWNAMIIAKGKKIPEKVDWKTAKDISETLKIPLHPKFTYFWDLVSINDIIKLKKNLGKWKQVKPILETLGVPHRVVESKVVVDELDNEILEYVLSGNVVEGFDPNEMINKLSPVKIMPKAGRFVGARMGRPEKAERRMMRGKPHVLFPAGRTERMRNIVESLRAGLKADLALRVCPKCKRRTYYFKCESCGTEAIPRFTCIRCGVVTTESTHCGLPARGYTKTAVSEDLYGMSEKLGIKTPALLKGVRGMSSNTKIPERLEKGLLRASYDLFVNKDGTVRIDSTDSALTHFKPSEVDVSIDKLIELGYEKDMFEKPLRNSEQILELLPQDILISDADAFSSADYLVNVTKFVDDLLTKFYGLEPFYNVHSKQDLVGKIVIGLAPHTSAGIVARIVGFTKARVGYAHPSWHAAKKRNCDGDEDSVILLMDALLNFSREYLPNSRGGKTMDVPLVLTTKLDLTEVDDEVHDMDIVKQYPLEFYEAAKAKRFPWDVRIGVVKDIIKKQNRGINYTHSTNDIAAGPCITAYRSLGPMLDKVRVQLKLAEKIKAVNERIVAEKVLETHFLKDIRGNLRRFGNQRFRCIRCNTKYDRTPLLGKCNKCGSKIVLTVYEGTVKKYYEPSVELAKKYQVSKYIKSRLDIIEKRMEMVFGRETERQEGLDTWLT